MKNNQTDVVQSLYEKDKELVQNLEIQVEKPVSLEGMQGTIAMSKLKQIAKEMSENWMVPTCVVAFLANTLQDKNSGRVIPWKDFRNTIIDIVNS